MPMPKVAYKEKILTFFIIFAVLLIPRGLYHLVNSEQIFSDMMHYYVIAKNIVSDFYFGIDEKLIAHKPPGSSVLIAATLIVDGDNFSYWYLSSVLVIEALGVTAIYFWLRHQYYIFFGLVFVGIVTLLRSSIFWSIKVSTEALTEALLLLAAASLLWMLTRSVNLRGVLAPAALAGIAAGWGLLVRPPFAATGVFLAIGLPMSGYGLALFGRISRKRANNIAAGGAVLFVAMMVVWAPWIARNAVVYGHFQPFSTHGVRTALWEYGGKPVDPAKQEGFLLELPDGRQIDPNIQSIKKASDAFENDFAWSAVLRPIAVRWYIDNAAELPIVFERRLFRMIDAKDKVKASGLSTLPRHKFDWPTGFQWVDALLIEWKMATWVLFAVSLLALVVLRPLEAIAMFGLVIVPFASFLVIHAIPRFLEPYIPLVFLTIILTVAEAAHRLRPPLIKFLAARNQPI